MSCSGIAFGLVNQAKTKTLIDGDAFMAWKNLAKRYTPHSTSDLIQLSGEFNKCALEDSSSDPDLWFIELNLIQSRMISIDSSFEKKEMEVIAHMINKLPNKYSEVITPFTTKVELL